MTDTVNGNGIDRAYSPGRPSIYQPEFAEQAEKLCRLGATDMELADFFGVTTQTIHQWRNTREDFTEAVMAGKRHADERVVRSLYNRAVGYTFESEKVFNNQGEIIRVPIREHVPPEPGAAMNWLKNRRPDEWRERKEVVSSGTVTIEVTDARQKLTSLLEQAMQDAKLIEAIPIQQDTDTAGSQVSADTTASEDADTAG